MKLLPLIVVMVASSPAPAQQRTSVAPKNMQNLTPALAEYTDGVLFGDVWRRPGLAPRDRSLVTVAVLVTTGKTAQLPGHTGRALDNGVRPQELAGLVTHLAFYAGWPSAVSALGSIEQVFTERRIDTSALRKGPPAEPSRTPGSKPTGGRGSTLDELTGSVVFNDLWRRPDLTPRDRSLVTLAALAAHGDDDQLAPYLRRSVENGVTPAEISEAFTHLAFYAGWPRAIAASAVADKTLGSTRGDAAGSKPGTEAAVQVVPPGGQPVRGPASNFTGVVTVTSPFKGSAGARLAGATVTFNPGAHSNWHVHPLGQLLVVTSGRGWVQAEGASARPIKSGDVVWTAPGVKHWHGASRSSPLTHVAISEAQDGSPVRWLGAVDASQYGALP
jgi:4-carboxymuconolactone decarboxylase